MRAIAEATFKAASAEAALFELRMRMCAGCIRSIQDLPIDTKLGDVRDAVLSHFHSSLSLRERELLKSATLLRNKILHCEFSSARVRLNEVHSKPRGGGVNELPIPSLAMHEIEARVRAVLEGDDIGQSLVAHTKTKTLRDTFAWLIEFQAADEFCEATSIFATALLLLDRLQTRVA